MAKGWLSQKGLGRDGDFAKESRGPCLEDDQGIFVGHAPYGVANMISRSNRASDGHDLPSFVWQVRRNKYCRACRASSNIFEQAATEKNVRLHVHGIAAVGEVEVLLLLLGVGSTEAKVTLLVDLGTGLAHVLSLALLVGEVLLDDVVRLHVNLLVGVVLALVDLLHAADLLDEESITVDGLAASTTLVGVLVHLADLENVLKTVKCDLDDLVVRAREQVAERLDAAALDQVADLSRLLQAAAGGIGNGPTGLLPGLEVAVLEKVDQRRDDVSIDDSLNLGGVAGGDVGDGPAGLLADAVLCGAQQGQQRGE